MNPRKPAIAFASSSSASITSSSRAQRSKYFRLHVAVKRLIVRRCLPPPSLASIEWTSGGLPETRAAATYRVLLFLAAGCARACAPASWSWRRRAAGGEPVMSFIFSYHSRPRELWSAPGAEPPMSLVCSCDSTSKRASKRQEAMVEVVPTEEMDRRRISVGLWLWLGARAQVNIAGEWQ